MRIHATSVARNGAGLILLGPSGSGKSDLALRLLDRGFVLVADDVVALEGVVARPVAALAGLLEVRGLGLLRLPHLAAATLRLALDLGAAPDRLPRPATAPFAPIPLLGFDGRSPSAAQRAAIALDCVDGTRRLEEGGLAVPTGHRAA